MVPLLTYDCASDETNSACSSGGPLSSASHSRVFCASGMLPPDRLPCGRLPCNDDPSKPIVALEAVPVDSLYRHVTSRLTQYDAEVTVTSGL